MRCRQSCRRCGVRAEGSLPARLLASLLPEISGPESRMRWLLCPTEKQAKKRGEAAQATAADGTGSEGTDGSENGKKAESGDAAVLPSLTAESPKAAEAEKKAEDADAAAKR